MIRTAAKSIAMAWLMSLSVIPAYAQSISPESVSRRVLSMASESKYDEALNFIEAQPDDVQNTYDVRFAKARILAWSGSYLKSGQVYRGLNLDFPNDPDVRVGEAYLNYFRGNLFDAEKGFQAVLIRHPDYLDAMKGLQAVKKAKKHNTPWKLDTGIGWSQFQNSENEDWTEQFMHIQRRFDKFSVNGQISRYDRFGQIDTSYALGVSTRGSGPWDAFALAGVTPKSDFSPKTFGEIQLGHSFRRQGLGSLRTAFSYRIDRYEVTDIHTLKPQLEYYLENGMFFTSQLIATLQSETDAMFGARAMLSAPLAGKLNFRLGGAHAPELVNGEVIQTDSIFAGLSLDLSDFTVLNIDYSRDDRANVYIRDGINVWLSHNF